MRAGFGEVERRGMIVLNGADGFTKPINDERNSIQNNETTLIVVDSRVLDRECLAHGLSSRDMEMDVVSCASIAEWRIMKDRYPPLAAILYSIGGQRPTDPGVGVEISRLVSEFDGIPVVILADTDDLVQILKALELGAKGYIPTSVHIDVCVEAINLALAGGVFLPASSVVAMRKAMDTGGDVTRPMASMFTQRQEEVVHALRRGKANKIIAYELNLRESTVKVHIRNIMKKLKATNRTEVAYKINEMFPGDMGVSG
jgi:DNA-binding NarL/FixJ family response regulator